ncbi:ABC transporter permease [Gaoshiqia sediminis]|uniref:ABC transporter permease n=1 Tax=Gaoshiqia sediminis TaxID=2986998 RepID=A0AA42C9U5_9BACT|nr:ABC transporter permease [Gaoshiqia sediminis]MCW0484486.1 ABC transporter permease [Gaoshiqia sediminis]
MFRTIIKISVRNLLKHKVYLLVNVFGLALGFTAFILIGLFIQFELSWDKTNEHYDRLYRVQRHYSKTRYAMDGNDISPHSRAITAQLLENQFPEFEKVTVIRENGGKFLSAVADRQIYVDGGICADSCYLDVFTYQFIDGTRNGALGEPFSILLSKTLADKLFPGERAMGRTVTIEKKFDLKVVGVYEDLPENTTIRPDYIVSFSTLAHTDRITRRDIRTGDCMTFALLKPGVEYKSAESKIKSVFAGYRGVEFEELQLCPMKKVYLDFNGNGHYYVVLVLYGLIGVFILIMSAFNYINLNTANAATRGKEVAVKKVSGSSRGTLIVQFLGETMLISLLALGLAFLLVVVFLPVFADISGRQLEFIWATDWEFAALSVLISLSVGILSGIYPALILSSNKIVSLFKGDLYSHHHEKFNLKKILVTTQFAISVFLISITISFSLQIRFLLSKDLGFNKENMIYTKMSVSKSGTSFSQLRDRILQHPEIFDASMSKHIPFVSFGGGMTNWEGGDQEEKISCRFNTVSYDFVRNMGIFLIAGRDFSRDFPGDIGNACLINESAAKCFDWDDPIGKRLKDNRLSVVGVVSDFIYKDMHNGIEPSILILASEEITGTWTFAFRVDPNKYQQAKAILEHEFSLAFPNDPFEFNELLMAFENENTFQIYRAINRTILFFTLFNIFLAIIGLLGLVSFTVFRRTKEIGVRKINGSSSLNIFCMLSYEYFILAFYAMVIAIPASWWVYEWIPSAYKLHIQAWVFALGGGILMIIILLTTSYQTILAATRNPVEALRYE